MNTTELQSTSMKVLLVDDDQELLELIRDYLIRDGFAVTCAHLQRMGARSDTDAQY